VGLDVVNHYLDLIFGRKRKKDSYTDNDLDYKNTQFFDLSIKEDIFHTRDYYNSNEYRWGDGSAKITDFELLHDVKTTKPSNEKKHKKGKVLISKEDYAVQLGRTIKLNNILPYILS
jgi:lipopolysaccharide transport system ATP-binding protein